MSRFLTAAALSIGLLVPFGAIAQDHDHHVWTAQEDPSWHQYLKEHHKKDHDWAKANKKEQADYWKWRDAHPDAH